MDQKIMEQLDELGRLYKEYDDVYRNYAAGIGFSEASFWVLYIVFTSEKPCTQYDLCSGWFYSKQTVNSAVNKLIKDGYMGLVPMPGTRNKKYIQLTQEGERLCREKVKPFAEAERRALSLLSEESRQELLLLTKEHTRNFAAEVDKLGEGK